MQSIGYTCLLLLGNVLANTETVQLNFPSLGFQECPYEETISSISLKDKNYVKETFELPIFDPTDSQFVPAILLHGIQRGESYVVKACWSALYPVSIDLLEVTSHISKSTETVPECYTDYIKIVLRNDSYPVLPIDTKVPINITVVNTKLKVPVDLLGTLIYIVLVMVGIGLLDRKINLYRMLAD